MEPVSIPPVSQSPLRNAAALFQHAIGLSRWRFMSTTSAVALYGTIIAIIASKGLVAGNYPKTTEISCFPVEFPVTQPFDCSELAFPYRLRGFVANWTPALLLPEPPPPPPAAPAKLAAAPSAPRRALCPVVDHWLPLTKGLRHTSPPPELRVGLVSRLRSWTNLLVPGELLVNKLPCPSSPQPVRFG